MEFLVLNLDADACRQEIYLRDLNLKFTNLKLEESVESAQVATATLYKDWQDIKLAEITQNRLILSWTGIQKQKLRSQMDQQTKNEKTSKVKYCSQGEPTNSDY